MDVEQGARELLAAEYRSRHCHLEADSILHGRTFLHDSAIKVIIAALTQGEMLESQLKAAVEVAEIAQRRADRAALTPPDGYVFAPVIPAYEMVKALAETAGCNLAHAALAYRDALAARPEVKP